VLRLAPDLHRDAQRGAAIIPLGPGSLRDSSSLPEGRSRRSCERRHRAGPALPSYLALLHAGFSVPPALLTGRWALTPPFHPCQIQPTIRGWLLVLPRACRRSPHRTGGLFSVALSVAVAGSQEAATGSSERIPAVAPWRYQARCPMLFTVEAQQAVPVERNNFGVRTFLPPTLRPANGSQDKPAITRLTRWLNYTAKPICASAAHPARFAHPYR